MLKALQEKRSKLMADRKALNELAQKDARVFTPEEKEKLSAWKKELEDLTFSIDEMTDSEQQASILDRAIRPVAGRSDTPTDPEQELDSKTLKGYSLMRAINCLAEKRPVDGLEGDASNHLAKKYGKPKGFYVPTYIVTNRLGMRPRGAAIDTTTGAGGVSTVTSSTYIDALRNLSILGPLGVTFLNDLQGKFSIPRSSGITSYWNGDGVAITAGSTTLDAVTFTDKPIGAYQDVTRSFMKQTSLSVESFLTDQIVRSIASGISTAAMNGTGGLLTPLGALNNTNSPLITMTTAGIATTGAVPTNLTGATMTWASMVALETGVANGNVMIDSGAYVLSTGGMGQAKTVAKASNAPLFIAEAGEINGYPAFATNGIPNTNGTNSSSGAALFGNWRSMVVALWGGLDITVDPYALATSGGLRIIGIQNVDVQEDHPEAFARTFGIRV